MPQPSARTTAGLITRESGQAVPLTGVTIDTVVTGVCARVTVTQSYVNRESVPVEAVYVFPLEEGAAVCGFDVIVDDTLVVGEVKDRDEAFKAYDDAMARGDGGFLLDEERPDVFQASIGNLPPGKAALVKLSYVSELSVTDTGIRFAIPTTVSPRYAPAEDRRGVGRPDAATLNPDLAWQVPYGLTLTVRLAMADPIAGIESPSHPIRVVLEGSQATISLSQADAALDRDFVLLLEAPGLERGRATVERGDDDEHAIALAFVPRFPNVSVPSELIFLLDRSGSMEGTSIEEVRRAVQLCLRSMTPGCVFNIVGFGSTCEALFPESRPYNQETLAEASAHAASLEADLGGTEILPALEFALRTPDRGLPRQIVVLTDGEVTNTDAVLALAGSHADRARIFTFGIGAGASHHLVRGLARAGRGTAEFIYPGERIEPKVLRQLGRLLSPSLSDVRVDWGGLDVRQAPAVVPPAFSGDSVLIYGFARNLVPAVARLHGTGPDGPVTFELPIDPASAGSGRVVSTLAARARIRELEESQEWLTARGSRQGQRRAGAAAAEVVRLSTHYSVISRETSFVAIERRETPVLGEVQLRRIPIALTTGWGGLAERVRSAAWLSTVAAPDMSRAPAFALMPEMFRLHRLDADAGAGESRVAAAPTARACVRPPSISNRALRPHDPMQALIVLQDADGSWDLSAHLARVVGRRLDRLDEAIPEIPGDTAAVRRAWATALALAWLDLHAAHRADEWRLLAAKARRWLETAGVVPGDTAGWVSRARSILEE